MGTLVLSGWVRERFIGKVCKAITLEGEIPGNLIPHRRRHRFGLVALKPPSSTVDLETRLLVFGGASLLALLGLNRLFILCLTMGK